MQLNPTNPPFLPSEMQSNRLKAQKSYSAANDINNVSSVCQMATNDTTGSCYTDTKYMSEKFNYPSIGSQCTV